MLTTNEVATLFGRSPRTIVRWLKEGLLDGVRPTGGKYLFPSNQPAIIDAATSLIRAVEEAEEDTVGDA